MTNGTDKDIGKLLAHAESHSNQLTAIFEKIEDIYKNGCPQGSQNESAIKSVKLEIKEIKKDTESLHRKLIKIVAALIVLGHLAGNGAPKLLEMLMR